MKLSNHRPRLVILLGPTGVGKTEAAIRLAGEYGGEIISADSMQVYRHMDIGTAKPTSEEQSLVKHHLIDIINPDEEFNAAMFGKRAREEIDRLSNEGKNILVVGGTGLYIKSLTGGLFDGPGADSNLRDSYREEMRRHGGEYLFEKLKKRDGAAAKRIHPNDVVRIIRALEVLELSGESIIAKQNEHNFGNSIYDYTKIGFTIDRDRLYKRINERVERMIRDGLVGEVERLIEMGYGETLKPMRSLGYRHTVNCIKGMCDIGEAVRLIKRDTRHYAKRQITWFRTDSEIEWCDPSDTDAVKAKIESFWE